MAGKVADPIGQVQALEAIDNYVENTIVKWETEENPTKISWWQFWKKVGLVQYQKATVFLLGALDDLIAYVDDKIDNGPDKKATVLAAIGTIYDRIVQEALPVWLKPFSKSVRDYIVYSLCSSAIDWIVAKYRYGEWRNKIVVDPEAQALFTLQKVGTLGLTTHMPGGGVLPKI